MTNYFNERVKYIEGDIIDSAYEGEFDVLIQGVNCFNRQKSGLAKAMVETFSTDKFPLEQIGLGSREKLGLIDYKVYINNFGKFIEYPEADMRHHPQLFVVNCYTQYKYGGNYEDGDEKPLDYLALRSCLTKINEKFKTHTIGIPDMIGCGLAGGNRDKVLQIIEETLIDVDIVFVKKK